MEKHLQAAGKTEKELAKALWDDNLTAVAEVRLPVSLCLSSVTSDV